MSSDRGQIFLSLISHALAEDLGAHGVRGDITTAALFDTANTGRAVIKSKQTGILSGMQILEPLFHHLDPALSVEPLLRNGDGLSPDSVICRLQGTVRGILAGERVALNFLQHLSGIATATHALAGLISHTGARLLDTRKTTPLLRLLEKEAVVHGGGQNHRFGLFDMILIKDTHVKAAGGVAPAIKKAKGFVAASGTNVKIEVEIQTMEEFSQALYGGVDRIMLDNMSVADMAACVASARKGGTGVELEASGNVSAQTIVAIAETGVDFISVGAITHSAPALDIHLVIE
jgi:nicotinate-nucleotide pyrophosphorylase (carboxylating)